MSRDQSVFVHEKGLCESDDVGPGTRIWAFAHVMKGARIGAGCNVCDHAFVESGAVLGDHVTVKNCVLVFDRVTVEDHVFLGPNMVFTNDLNPRVAFKKDPAAFLPTLVRRGASIGANVTVVCGVTIGTQAFVGAGSVVIRDVPAHARVVGNPARQIGWSCSCGEKLPASLRCSCGRRYRKDGAGLAEAAPVAPRKPGAGLAGAAPAAPTLRPRKPGSAAAARASSSRRASSPRPGRGRRPSRPRP